jgi:ElaB/YqjD/DUF883 family membrane-anchored ribosome-binding protein
MGLRNFLKQIFGQDEVKAMETEQKIQQKATEAGEMVEKVGSKIMEEAKPVLDSMSKTAEELGSQILEGTRELSDKAAEMAGSTGSKIIETTDKVWEDLETKASEISKKIQENEVTKKAGEMAEEAGKRINEGVESALEGLRETVDKVRQKMDEPKEDPFKPYEKSHEERSHLDALKQTPGMDSGSFFDKASRFADGDYDAVKGNPEPVITQTGNTAEKDSTDSWAGNIHGFSDHDGDGDPLIDDAEVEEEK